MEIFKLGDKSKGVPTTFKLCTAPLLSGKGNASDILQHPLKKKLNEVESAFLAFA